MSPRSYRVKELARLSGVTVRTLHHYDSIGLLVPSARTDSGYRVYSGDDLGRLQQILIWRELGLSLEKIRSILDDPDRDRRNVLLDQRGELLERRRRTDAMIRSVDRALEILKGDDVMDAKVLFDGFDPSHYEHEARERWADTDAYREAARRTKHYQEGDWSRMKAEQAEILDELAEKMKNEVSPAVKEVTDLAERHRLHIDRWFYPCSREMHAGLAEMYLADERFAKKIDEHGEGLTRYLVDAVRANTARD